MLQPSRKDTFGPPKAGRNVTDLAALVRHQQTYLRNLDPGMLGGRLGTPKPVGTGPSELVGGDDGGGADDGSSYEWQWDDTRTLTTDGLPSYDFTLTYEPVEESLMVMWHPGGYGGVPVHKDTLSVDGNVITISNSHGAYAAGDVFTAQYQFDPGFLGEPLVDFASYMFALTNATDKSVWLRLGDPVGAVALDSSGNAHDATAASMGFGQPGLVDGDPDTSEVQIAPGRARIPYASWMDSTKVSGFILFKTTNTDLNGICFMSRWDASVAELWSFDHVNGNIRLRLNGGSTIVTTSGLSLNDGGEHMAGFTLNGSVVRLFTENGEVKTQAVSAPVSGGIVDAYVGADLGGGGGSLLHHFAGTLDEAAVDFSKLWTPTDFENLATLAGIV